MDNNSWESGVKFVEEKKPKKFARFLILVLIVFFSASFGGILGGYYVKKNYTVDKAYQLKNQNAENNILNNIQPVTVQKSSITQVAEIVGPAVVGVDNNVKTWAGGTATQGSGSGIIFDKEGYIVTNEHVITGASSVTVTLSGGKSVVAQVIGKDINTDLAVLKINSSNLPVAKFGDSSKVRVGDVAIAIGNPLGEEFAGTVTVGVISALNRKITMENDRTYKVIQTDASINPGNSGGALCNEVGEVIGINSLKRSDAEGMGFAIPIDEVKPIIQSLIKSGYVSRPFLGINYRFIDSELSKEYKVPEGVGVEEVISGSAAELAGIKPGDVIIELDGVKLKKSSDLKEIMSKHKVGDVISAKIYRDGKENNMQIKLGDSNGR